MINYILNWWRAYKERGRLSEIDRLRDTFRIKEKNGALWIMHNDTAVFRLEPFTTMDECVSILKDFRDFAVEYAFGVYSERIEGIERGIADGKEHKCYYNHLENEI